MKLLLYIIIISILYIMILNKLPILRFTTIDVILSAFYTMHDISLLDAFFIMKKSSWLLLTKTSRCTVAAQLAKFWARFLILTQSHLLSFEIELLNSPSILILYRNLLDALTNLTVVSGLLTLQLR